jgi:hypothetical protein
MEKSAMSDDDLKCIKCGKPADGYISLGDLYEAPLCEACEKYVYIGWRPIHNDITRSEVLEFIHRRFKTDCNWKTGNCYYFAIILKERFKDYEPELYYDTLEGHFICRICSTFYDWSGVIYNDYEYLKRYVVKWDDFEEYDKLQFKRILNDVIM